MDDDEMTRVQEAFANADPFYDIFRDMVRGALNAGHKVTLVETAEQGDTKYTANIRPASMPDTFAMMYGIRVTLTESAEEEGRLEEIAKGITSNYKGSRPIIELY